MPSIRPYTAICLVTSVFDAKDRKEIRENIERISSILESCSWAEPKLVALTEGALQGFTDEVDWIAHGSIDEARYAREWAIEIPGEETDLLGEEAKRYGAYILVQAKAKLPEFPDTYFNAQFLIKPDGKPFAQPNGRPYMHCKNLVCTLVEPSTTPHDVYDRWVEVFGDGLDAFFPVARTPDIGNIGSCICAEKNALPESFRALTLNGAEVIYAPAAIERPTDIYEAICRARAADYCCYILAPNVGRHYLDREGKRVGFATGGGHASYMIDPLGTVIGRTSHETDTWIIGTIDIEYLRGLRSRIWYGPASFKVEIFKGLFKQSIYPRGFKPRSRAEVSEIRRRVIQKLAEEGRLGVP